MNDIGWYFRLLTERDELDTRIQDLKMFIKSDTFNSLDDEEARLLRDQLQYMQGYKRSLDARQVDADLFIAEQKIGVERIQAEMKTNNISRQQQQEKIKEMLELAQGMKPYIGVKQIKAKPMTLGEYYELRGWDIGDKDPSEQVYLVEYQDSKTNVPGFSGYVSYSPKEVFEAAYLELSDPTKITKDVVDNFVTIAEGGVTRQRNHTVVLSELSNGMTTVTDAACVDPNNYDESIGKELALKKTKDKVFFGLGFVLAWARNGLK